MSVLIVTGTGTEIGKTVVTVAIASLMPTGTRDWRKHAPSLSVAAGAATSPAETYGLDVT